MSPPKPLKINSSSWHFTAEILPFHLLTLPLQVPILLMKTLSLSHLSHTHPSRHVPRALSDHYLPRCCFSVPAHSHGPQTTPLLLHLFSFSIPNPASNAPPSSEHQNNVFASLVAPILRLVIVVPTNLIYWITSSENRILSSNFHNYV